MPTIFRRLGSPEVITADTSILHDLFPPTGITVRELEARMFAGFRETVARDAGQPADAPPPGGDSGD